MKPLCAVVLGLATMVALTASAKADDTAKLIGKWEVTKSAGETPEGTIVNFEKDGKMAANLVLDGKELKLDGTYKLDGKKLAVKLKLNEEKIEHEFTITFKGDDELELEYSDKKVDVLKRKK